MIDKNSEIYSKLLKNSPENFEKQFPLLKMTLMGTDHCILLSCIQETHLTIAYGLYDFGDGIFLGDIELEQLLDIRGPDCRGNDEDILFTQEELAEPIFTPDHLFVPVCSLAVYHQVALDMGIIETDYNSNRELFQKYMNSPKL